VFNESQDDVYAKLKTTDERYAFVATKANIAYVASIGALAIWYRRPLLFLVFAPTEFLFRYARPGRETDFISTTHCACASIMALGTCTFGIAYAFILGIELYLGMRYPRVSTTAALVLSVLVSVFIPYVWVVPALPVALKNWTHVALRIPLFAYLVVAHHRLV
jgi:hypothetical protein